MFGGFGSDRYGSIAIIMAFALFAIVFAIGAAVDIARVNTYQAAMQGALDAAVLNATAQRSMTGPEKVAFATSHFQGNARNNGVTGATPEFVASADRMTGSATGRLETTFLGIVGLRVLETKAHTEAVVGDDALEVALALDVTGSMAGEMAGLRSAASDLVSTVFREARGSVKIGLVPFAAEVNPGQAALAGALDVNANASSHGRFLEYHWIAHGSPAGQVQPGVACTGPGAAQPPVGTPPGGDKISMLLDDTADFLSAVFGSSAAFAQQAPAVVTPATSVPLAGLTLQSGRLWPTGFQYLWTCADKVERLANPAKISTFDLFNRLSGVTWKGCVEARTEPEDVQDTVPAANKPKTLFYPFFWPDGVSSGSNNWIADDYWNAPTGWRSTSNPKGDTYNDAIFKYNPQAKLSIDEVPPLTRGPNKGCPDQIQALTNDQPAIQAKIANLSHWDSGGTVTSEGVAWAWRVLSPTPPYTQGSSDRNVRKVIVLMSDGENEILADDPTPWKSQLTAYSGLRYARLPQPRTFADAGKYLDTRARLACANAKAAGIEIYTVLFRSTAQRAMTLMSECASNSDHVFTASNATSLGYAFSEIAQNISKLRIAK